MTKPRRVFHAEPAVRKSAPLLIGIMSASGAGKTFSALRLATGMARVYGGPIYGVDTENYRMLHYADQFKFHHVPFAPPFGSLDYLEALRWCSSQGAKITIVDSMTHEHIGEGGYLETAENTVTRIAGPNATWKDREKVQLLGWATAGPLRQKMIEGLKQLSGAFIFCWRAKEKTKPIKRADGKTDVVEMGFMPLGGEDWIYEMMVNCMLEPRSDGVPTWRSDYVGERLMMKLPQQFKNIFAERAPLSEDIGEKLAQWAMGTTLGNGPLKRSVTEPENRRAGTPHDSRLGDVSTPLASSPETAADSPPPPTQSDGPAGEPDAAHTATPAGIIDESERIDRLDASLAVAAEQGIDWLQQVWSTIPRDDQKILKAALDRRHKPAAAKVDAERAPSAGELPLCP